MGALASSLSRELDFPDSCAPRDPPMAEESDKGFSRFLPAPLLVRLLDEIERAADGDGKIDAYRLLAITRWLRRRAIIRTEGNERFGSLIKWRLKRVTTYVDDHLAEPMRLGDLAQAAGLSKMYFAAQFRAATGFSPHEYVLRRRIECAMAHLELQSGTIVEIAGLVGFQNQAHFTTMFKRFVGQTPARWRDNKRHLNNHLSDPPRPSIGAISSEPII